MSRLQQRFHSSPGKHEGIEPLNLSECCNTKDYANSSASASARSLPRAKSAVFTENGVVDEKQRDKEGQRQTSASTDEKLDGNPSSACTVLSAVVLQKSADVWPIRSSPSVGGTLAAPFDSAHFSKDLHPLTDRRRRSSIILNKRMPMRKTESGELGDRTASKLTLDEELYDILHAFLYVFDL
ncbi:hypothetical protein niasHT_002650 [Heterodera trifolii]|uniref:Uncharacterized protein n=1 Tax=Heterodera trifolii TaxID=157864 RepID=A0ABD2LUN3_9BILA